LLQGVKVTGRGYGGGWLDWLTPFSLLTGASVLAAYALLGSTWLIAKTEGEAQKQAYRLARRYGVITLIAIAAVSAATPFLAHDYYTRWLTMPGILLTAPVPVLVAVLGYLFWRALGRGAESAPFLLTLALFALCFIGLGISMYPYIVPDAVTIWDAASPASSQGFICARLSYILHRDRVICHTTLTRDTRKLNSRLEGRFYHENAPARLRDCRCSADRLRVIGIRTQERSHHRPEATGSRAHSSANRC